MRHSSDPFDEIFDLVDRIFGHSNMVKDSSIMDYKYDKIVNGDKIYYTFELREYTKDDIHIEPSETHLDIIITKPGLTEGRHRIDIPFPIIPKKTKVTFKNGILDITLVRDVSKSPIVDIED